MGKRLVGVVCALALMGLAACTGGGGGGPIYTQKTIGFYDASVLGQVYRDGIPIGGYLASPGDVVNLTYTDDNEAPDGDAATVRFSILEGDVETNPASYMLGGGLMTLKSDGTPDIDTYTRAVAKLLGQATETAGSNSDYTQQDTAIAPLASTTKNLFAGETATTAGVTLGTSSVTFGVPLETAMQGPTPYQVTKGPLRLTSSKCWDVQWEARGVSQSCAFVYKIAEDDPTYQYAAVEAFNSSNSGTGDFSLRRLGMMQDVQEGNARMVGWTPDHYINPSQCHSQPVSFSISVVGVGVGLGGNIQTCPDKWGPYHPPIYTGEYDTFGSEWVGLEHNRYVSSANDVVFRRVNGQPAKWRMQTSLRVYCGSFPLVVDCGVTRFP